jgi:hypothetical protein
MLLVLLFIGGSGDSVGMVSVAGIPEVVELHGTPPSPSPPQPGLPLWDPSHPDRNPGARPLAMLNHKRLPVVAVVGAGARTVAGVGTVGRKKAIAAGSPPPNRIFVSKSAIHRVGLFIQGRAMAGDNLLASLGDDAAALATEQITGSAAAAAAADTGHSGAVGGASAGFRLRRYRVLASLNHCWKPNAALVRTADSHQRHRQHQRGANPGGGAGGGAGGAAAGVRYKLVALRDFFAAAPSPQELLIDYSAVPWLAEAPRMGWKCADEAGQPVEYKDVRRRYNTDPSISVREDLLGGFVRPALRASASAVSAIRHLPTPTAGGASGGAGRADAGRGRPLRAGQARTSGAGRGGAGAERRSRGAWHQGRGAGAAQPLQARGAAVQGGRRGGLHPRLHPPVLGDSVRATPRGWPAPHCYE